MSNISFLSTVMLTLLSCSCRTDLAVAAPLDRISHGEEVQLVHGITGRNLNSHNVAAPSSPTKQVK